VFQQGVIKGLGIQERAISITIVVYWIINIPLSCLFAFAPFNLGLMGLWLGMAFGMIVMSAAF